MIAKEINKRPFEKSLSPFSKDFVSCLPPEMKDIVLTLRSKLYWTLTSCDGYTFKDSRNFTVAFRRKKEARAFMALLNHHVKGLTTKVNDPEYHILDEEIKSRDLAVDTLNTLFRTRYQDFFIVEVRITDYIYSSDSVFTKIKKSIDRILFKEKRTEALLKYLREGIEYYWH